MYPYANMQARQADPAQLVYTVSLTIAGPGFTAFTMPAGIVQAGDFAIVAGAATPAISGGVAIWSPRSTDTPCISATLGAGDIGVGLQIGGGGANTPHQLAIFRNTASGASTKASALSSTANPVNLSGFTPASNTRGALVIATAPSATASLVLPTGWTQFGNANVTAAEQVLIGRLPFAYPGGTVAIANAAGASVTADLLELLG